MSLVRRGGVFAAALFTVACAGAQPTSPPSNVTNPPASTPAPSAAPASQAPSAEPTAGPGASLDPALSDAGIVARVTISNDTRGGRDGTHDIIGVADDGSECSGAFEEPEYIVIAWYDDAPIGQIHRFGVSVGADDVPDGDGAVTGIDDGGVSFDFVSESGFGTQYTGNATRENEGSVTIDVTRTGPVLSLDFEGVTNDGVNFAGQLICSEA
jgi:hypothetical protein